jgi:DNA-binding NarL/FixJ family response regulator
MRYKISFIEDEDKIKKEVTARLEEEFEVVDIPLYKGEVPVYSELKDLAMDIFNSKPKLDAIIIDYSFVDKTLDIKFDGAELVKEIQKMMPEFPIFVLSAKEEAESSVPDANSVYIKKEYLQLKDFDKKLHRKIKIKIGHYKEKISDAEKRLKELLKKQEGEEKLTLYEEEELIDLDDFLESTQLSSIKVPSSLKETSNIKKLDELINRTDKLINKIESEGKDA